MGKHPVGLRAENSFTYVAKQNVCPFHYKLLSNPKNFNFYFCYRFTHSENYM